MNPITKPDEKLKKRSAMERRTRTLNRYSINWHRFSNKQKVGSEI